MDTDAISRGLHLIEDGIDLLRTGPMDFYLRQLIAARKLLLERFSPFKVGDRVTLREPYQTKTVTGWSTSAHFLIPGSLATVIDSDCTAEGVLVFGLRFDNETFIYDGIEKPVTQKHLFRFREDELERVKQELAGLSVDPGTEPVTVEVQAPTEEVVEVWQPCPKTEFCIREKDHEGACDEIPF